MSELVEFVAGSLLWQRLTEGGFKGSRMKNTGYKWVKAVPSHVEKIRYPHLIEEYGVIIALFRLEFNGKAPEISYCIC